MLGATFVVGALGKAFSCPRICNGCCENKKRSNKVQQLLSEAEAATTAIVLKHQLQEHTMGCKRDTVESRSLPPLVFLPLEGLTDDITSFSL